MNRQSNEDTRAVLHPAIATGSRPVTWVAAHILQLAVLALLAAPTVYARPRWDVLITGSLWFAFSIYWSIAV
ncbi:MAG TPA: hypothetical protein VGS59_04060 [Candidatus Acidoferrales bacterium]|nr:hypothetical protein [Candidatus Acidoferrales bacterium]